MINDIKFQLPSLYLTKPIESTSLENIKNEDFNVIKRIYMIKNEVNPEYHFMELDVSSGFSISAKIIPNYTIIGSAAIQLKKEKIKNKTNSSPYFKISTSLYKINEYQKVWEFDYITKRENEIYKIIKKIKKQIANELK